MHWQPAIDDSEVCLTMGLEVGDYILCAKDPKFFFWKEKWNCEVDVYLGLMEYLQYCIFRGYGQLATCSGSTQKNAPQRIDLENDGVQDLTVIFEM